MTDELATIHIIERDRPYNDLAPDLQYNKCILYGAVESIQNLEEKAEASNKCA